MATNLRYLLHEEMYDPNPYTTRKEASILGRLDVENYNSSSRRASSADPYERSKARRRRIYENEYNRPYPARKKMHMWTDEDVSSPTQRVSQVTPSPTMRKSSRESGFEYDVPDDESIDELTPRNLWKRVTCNSIGTFGTNVVNRVHCLSRPSEDGASTIDFSDEVDPDSSIMMTGITTTDSMMVTPKRQTSKSFLTNNNMNNNSTSKSSNHDMSPVYTPIASPASTHGPSMEGTCLVIPSAPMKKTLDRVRPIVQDSAAVLRSRWQRAKSQNEPKLQKQNEALRKLHKFLHTGVENQLKLYIDDYQESTFDRIVESLYGNIHLKTLLIQRNPDSHPHGTYRTKREMACLFEAIRCLPHLRSLIVVNVHEDVLPALVENLPRGLRSFRLYVMEGDIPSVCLDELASHSHLRRIDLESEESIDIGRLINSASLQSIRVRGTNSTVDATHMQGLADALSCNIDSPLRVLDIQPWMDFSSWKHLADALRFNNSLESVEVSVVADTCDEADATAMVLAELLQSNSTLTHIVNKIHETLMVTEDTVNGPVLDALLANKTLKKLRFFDEDPLFWMAKDAILKRNKDYSENNRKDEDHDKGDFGQAFFDQYVSFAALLPGFKQRMCAYC